MNVPYTQLPKEVAPTPGAIPFTVMTAVTTVDTEVAAIVVSNSTAGSLTLTVQDTQGTPIKVLDAVAIDNGSPVILPFDPPVFCKGGVQWQASATGLSGFIRGRRVLGLTMGAATAQTGGQTVPV